MAEYIERTEELMLAMNAGARAIENTRRYHGAIYTKDVFLESPQEIPYLQAAKVLREVSDAPAADVAPVRHGRWEEADWVEPDCHGFVTIITPKAALRCSNCKNCFKKELLWKDNYCPNCGTDMRGRNDE